MKKRGPHAIAASPHRSQCLREGGATSHAGSGVSHARTAPSGCDAVGGQWGSGWPTPHGRCSTHDAASAHRRPTRPQRGWGQSAHRAARRRRRRQRPGTSHTDGNVVPDGGLRAHTQTTADHQCALLCQAGRLFACPQSRRHNTPRRRVASARPPPQDWVLFRHPPERRGSAGEARLVGRRRARVGCVRGVERVGGGGQEVEDVDVAAVETHVRPAHVAGRTHGEPTEAPACCCSLASTPLLQAWPNVGWRPRQLASPRTCRGHVRGPPSRQSTAAC